MIERTGGNGPHADQPVLTRGAPLGSAAAVMIMLHGRNAGPENILQLAAPLAHPGFCFLAPAALNRSWYPLSFLAARELNEPGLSSALAVIGDLIRAVLEEGIPSTRVMLLGFSQGACLSLETAWRSESPDRLGGVIGLSGGLIGPPGTAWDDPPRVAGMPVLLGCSDVDGHIPRERVEETARAFESAGARVTLRLFPGMGHLVNDEELELTRAVMRDVAATAG